jgi:DNA polymerase alpha subunit B
MTDTAAELNELFVASFPNGLPKDILGELQSILRIHLITAEELFYKWESYSIKMGDEVKLSMETVRGFKQDVQEALERESRGKVGRQTEKRPMVTATPRSAAGTDVFGMYEDEISGDHVNRNWLTMHD